MKSKFIHHVISLPFIVFDVQLLADAAAAVAAAACATACFALAVQLQLTASSSAWGASGAVETAVVMAEPSMFQPKLAMFRASSGGSRWAAAFHSSI